MTSLRFHHHRTQFPRGSSESLPTDYHQRQQAFGATDGAHLAGNTVRRLQVPNVVLVCIAYLTAYGMSTVGIFRIGTNKKRVDQVRALRAFKLWSSKNRLHFAPLLPPQLRDEFDRGTRTGFEETVQPHDVAYLLKDFLRSMPEPLLCRSLYGALLETQSECWSCGWSSRNNERFTQKSHRILVEVTGEIALSDQSCRRFGMVPFKSVDFELDGKLVCPNRRPVK